VETQTMTEKEHHSVSRTERAVVLRDHLLPLLHERGQPSTIADGIFVTWSVPPWRFALRTPFMRTPAAPPAGTYERAVAQQRAKPTLPYGLDVWCGRKVLSVAWSDSGFEMISFTRGDWEDELLALS
jgi:hypothetical protein